MKRLLPVLLLLAGFCQAEVVSQPFKKDELGALAADPSVLFSRLPTNRSRINYANTIEEWHPDKRLYGTAFACGSVCLGDLNNDGRTDVFVCGGAGNRLYLQMEGAFGFTDNTPGHNIEGGGQWASGAVMADIDNDGDLDLYVCYYDWPNQLFINNLTEDGALSFEEKAADFNLNIKDASLVPAFADYDRDGDLDLYLLTHQLLRQDGRPSTPVTLKQDSRTRKLYVDGETSRYFEVVEEPDEKGRWAYRECGRPDFLYRNDKGKFVDVSKTAGIIADRGIGNSVTWWDYDRDGWPDIYVGNGGAVPDRLYRNQANGKFEEVSKTVLPYTPRRSMAAAVMDANDDTLLDMIVCGQLATNHYKRMTTLDSPETLAYQRKWTKDGAPQVHRNTLYLASGGKRLLEAACLAKLDRTDWCWSVASGDYDQDGREDLYFLNGVARNYQHADLPKFSHEDLVGKSHWDLYDKTAGDKREQNLAFRGLGNLEFEDVSQQWGLDFIGMSYSYAQGDLDNDGDLDLVLSSLNDFVYILLNEGASGNSIRFRFRGTKSNKRGIGVRVYLTTDSGKQVRELRSASGFTGGNEDSLHFGLGVHGLVRELAVHWPSGIVQNLKNLPANSLYTITEQGEKPDAKAKSPKPFFSLSNSLSGYVDKEEAYDDYKRQPLLPYKLSQFGPTQAWGDVDSDGRLDLYIGGSMGKSGRLIYNKSYRGTPRFDPWIQKVFSSYRSREETGSVLFDADGDGDLDLYVGCGGVELEPGNGFLRDRLLLNSNRGSFKDYSSWKGPEARESTSTVSVADFDQDGDLDLFVGCRSVIGEFPKPADSRLLVNEKGSFRDATEELAPGLLGTGMVTSSLWTDVDSDGWVDLVVAHDWGPIKVLHNLNGRLDDPHPGSTDAGSGCWNGLAAGDIDRDGDMDLVASNLGTNTRYRASGNSPAVIFYGQMEDSGKPRIVEATFENGVCYPLRGYEVSKAAMPFLESAGSHHKYASSSLSQLHDIRRLKEAAVVKVNQLQSGALYNDGSGNFRFVPFPKLAQIAPSYGIALEDFNLDGYLDCFLAQNFLHARPETGPLNAGLSQLLLAQPDTDTERERFRVLGPAESGIEEPGDATSLAVFDLNGDQWPDAIMGVNNQSPRVYLNSPKAGGRPLRVQLKGQPGNATGIGARVTVEIAGIPPQVAEVRVGGSFLASVNGPLLFARPIEPVGLITVTVLWPDRRMETQTFDPDVEDIVLSYPEEDQE